MADNVVMSEYRKMPRMCIFLLRLVERSLIRRNLFNLWILTGRTDERTYERIARTHDLSTEATRTERRRKANIQTVFTPRVKPYLRVIKVNDELSFGCIVFIFNS
jgi:hypothetical protein